MNVATGSFIDKNYLTSEIVYMNCEQNKTNRNQIVTFKFTFEDKGFKNFKSVKNHFKLIFLKPNWWDSNVIPRFCKILEFFELL